MKTILAIILITVWVVVATISLIDWISKVIERRKLRNMPQKALFIIPSNETYNE